MYMPRHSRSVDWVQEERQSACMPDCVERAAMRSGDWVQEERQSRRGCSCVCRAERRTQFAPSDSMNSLTPCLCSFLYQPRTGGGVGDESCLGIGSPVMLTQGGMQSSLGNRYPISGARTVGAIAVGFFPLSRFDHLARTFRGTACVADVYISV